MGEAVLQRWCAELGIPCNKATQDRGGWDYLLELEPHAPAEPNVPLDRRPAGRNCLVQVKSTDGQSGRASVKLSNWRRLATSPLPAFFLVLEFDGRPEPVHAYLVQVWRPWISKVLERLRRQSRDEPEVDLSSRRMTLKWSSAEQLVPAAATSLLRALNESIGPDAGEYAAEKRKLLDELGYEGDTGHFKVTVRIPEGRENSWAELWADLQLGLVEELETTGGAFWDRRFGIQTTEPQRVFDTVGKIVRGKEPPLRGPLEFRAGTRRVRVAADILVASLTGAQPTSLDELKLRIRLPFLDIVTAPRDPSCAVTWRWPPVDAVTPLHELASLARILAFISETARSEESEVWLLNTRLAVMSASSDQLPSEQSEMVWCVLGAWEIAKIADLQDRAGVTLEGLWLQREAIRAARAVLRQNARDASIILDADESGDLEERRWTVPVLLSVWFDSDLVVVPVLHEGAGSITADGSQYVVTIERSRVCEPRVFGVDEEIDEVALCEEVAGLIPRDEVLRWWEVGGAGSEASEA